MSIGLSSQVFRTQTRGAVDLALLQACIGEEINVITTAYSNDFIYSNGDVTITFVPNPADVDLPYTQDLIAIDGADFSSFSVGDSILVKDTTRSYVNDGVHVIKEIISPTLIRLTAPLSLAAVTPYAFLSEGDNGYIANITELKSLIYQYGVKPDGSFTSEVDGSTQKYITKSIVALATSGTTTPTYPQGLLDWQNGSEILSILGDDYDSNFPAGSRPVITITHKFIVSPFYLVGQYNNMQLGLPPDYFKPDNILKYAAQVDWNKNNLVSNQVQSLPLPAVGQFGWFGTKYDGSKPDYSISSLTIKRISDSSFVNQLEYDEIEVKFTITSAGANFDTVNTGLVFGFNYLPEDEALYQNTNRLMSDNFAFESIFVNPNNTPVNGANLGNSKQIIKTINAQVLTTTTCQVIVRILFGSDRVAILRQEDVAQYDMWVIVERTDLDIEISDKCNLLVQVSTIYEQLTTINLLSENTLFIEHPYTSVVDGQDTLQMFPVDDVAANTTFSLDYTGHENEGILLKSCTPTIVLSHDTQADIVLDSVRINLDNFPIIGSAPGIQAIDYNSLRPYKIEDGIRKYISFQRDYALDTGEIRNFVLNFPFMNRWEYWLQLAALINIPDSLFDNTVPFNGSNNLWDRLANSTGWTLNYKIKLEIQQNGELFEQDFTHVLTSTYFESNTDWTNCNIKTYDNTTGDQIIIGSNKYAYSNADTLVKCTFEKTTGDVPDIANVAMVIWAEGFEGGGVTEITRISSVYPTTSDSLFKSIDGSNLVVMSKSVDTFTGQALLSSAKIQNKSKLTIYARIYEVTDLTTLDRITNDFIIRITNDGQARLVLG